MTKDQLDTIIALGPLIIAGAVGTTTAMHFITKFFDLQKTKIQEKSVGLTKIVKFEEAHQKVLVDMQELRQTDINLKKTDEEQQHQIDKLDEDYREVIRRVLDFYKGSK